MTDWIEAIAARVGMEAHMRDGTVEKFATITEAERDRFVALARGVEAMAAALAGEARMTSIVSVKTFKRDMAAELRRPPVVGDGVVWGSASFVVRTLEDGRIAGVGMGLKA